MRSITATAGLLKDNNLIMISEVLVNMITDVKGTKELRDVYSLAIRNTIAELNDKAAVKLIKIAFPRLMTGIKS